MYRAASCTSGHFGSWHAGLSTRFSGLLDDTPLLDIQAGHHLPHRMDTPSLPAILGARIPGQRNQMIRPNFQRSPIIFFLKSRWESGVREEHSTAGTRDSLDRDKSELLWVMFFLFPWMVPLLAVWPAAQKVPWIRLSPAINFRHERT